MPGPLDHKTPEERDARRRARAADRVRGTAFGATHPAIVALTRWLDMQASTNTIEASAADCLPFLAFCTERELDPLALTRSDARLYVATLGRLDLAPSTIARRACVLRSYYAELEDEGIIATNPFYRVKAGSRDPIITTPALTLEQTSRLVEMAGARTRDGRGTPHDHRNAAMAYLMVRIGPRCMEVAGARWGHVAARGDAIEWRIHGKGNRWGAVILPDDVVEVLADWRAALEAVIRRPVRPTDALFPALDSIGVEGTMGRRRAEALRAISRRMVSRIFTDLLADIGISGPRYSAHVARATAATLAYAATRDVVAVQRLLRHRNQTTTLGYIRNATTETPAAEWRPDAHLPLRGSVRLAGPVEDAA